MLRNTFLVILLFVSCSASAQFTITVQWQPVKPGIAGDTIFYNPERKLKWSDFTGRPDAASAAAAVTESGFGYKMSMQSYNRKTTVVITVFCYFNKNKSWVKKDMDTEYALLHEQHHYDITYINTSLFVKKLQEAQFNKGNFEYLVEKIHDASFEALSKMQDEYDGQTANGRIVRMQRVWNKKIDDQLATLSTR